MTKQIQTPKKVNLTGVSFAQAKNEALRLYNISESAWIDLCVYLREIENTGLWMQGRDQRGKAFAHFGDFMHDTFPAAFGEEAYRNRISFIESWGEAWVRDQGIDADASHSLNNPELLKRPERKAQVKAVIEDNRKTFGVAPSISVIRQNVNSVLRDVQPARPTKRLASAEECTTLRNEVGRLKLELKKVTKERDDLLAKVVKLENRLTKARGQSAKSASNSASA